MKVLLINGSPNEFGCTYTALTEAQKVFEKNGVETEIVYLGAILGNDSERVEKYQKELEKRNLAKNSVNSQRAQYAYCKLIKKDAEAIDTALRAFEKKIEKEAYTASKEFERRQMEYIDGLNA